MKRPTIADVRKEAGRHGATVLHVPGHGGCVAINAPPGRVWVATQSDQICEAFDEFGGMEWPAFLSVIGDAERGLELVADPESEAPR